VTARQLIDAGREHIAAGRSDEAVRCFTLAADDPTTADQARTMLAAAYLLPGTTRPAMALRQVRTVAEGGTAGGEALTDCALVALAAGDPQLAEELAGRAVADHPSALPILGAAMARRGDRAGVARVLAARVAAGPAHYWHRLMHETGRHGWLRETLAAARLLRRSGLPAPAPATIVLRELLRSRAWGALSGFTQSAGLGGAGLAAALLPLPFAFFALVLTLAITGANVPTDLDDGRPWMAVLRLGVAGAAVVTALAHWLA
jgi:hypothetical protein